MDVQIPPAAIHQGASWEYGGRGHATQMHTFAGLELPLTPHDLLMLLSKAPPLLVYEQARVSPDAVALLDGDAFARICEPSGTASNTRRILCYTDGSYYPPGPGKPAAAGWACVFLEPEVGGFNCTYGNFPEWLAAPTEELSAYLGE